MTTEEKAKAYDEALETARQIHNGNPSSGTAIVVCEQIFPQLKESEDERMRKELIDFVNHYRHNTGLTAEQAEWCKKAIAYLEKQKEDYSDFLEEDKKYMEKYIPLDKTTLVKLLAERDRNVDESLESFEKQKEQKSIKMEVYEVGKGTTICGQDYKCKKDYKEGNCWYIKDVIYHCGRDGYLTDQNGVSWSCTPEWFNEYIYTNNELAEKEKNDFVSGQFLQCKFSFDGFKEGEHYWLEYIGDDMYVGRSDNILNQKFHITPRQLYTLFSQQLEGVQGPPQEEKQASLNYEPPFDENPSDKEIIEALIKHLKEQDGFLTAINCVSTKAILSWLKKQKEQKHPNGCFTCDEYKKGYEEGRRNGFTAGYNKAMKEVEQKEQKPADLSEMMVHKEPYIAPVPTPMVADEQKPAEWSEEYENIRQALILLVSNDKKNGYTEFYKTQEITCDKVIAFLKKLGQLPTNEEMLRTLRAEYEKGVADTIAKYEQKDREIEVKDYRLRDVWEYVDEFVKKFGRIPKDIDELSACVDYVIKHKSIDEKDQKKSLSERFRSDFPAVADFIENVDNMEKNRAIEILEDYLKWAISSEEECSYTWKELANAIQLGINTMKEHKPNIELIQRSWYMEGYNDRKFGNEPKWIIKTGEGGPKHELNPKYGQPLTEQQVTEEQLHNLNEAIKSFRMDGCDRIADSLHSLYNILTKEQKPVNESNMREPTLDEARKWNEAYEKGYSLGYKNGRNEQKPAEWSEEDEEKLKAICTYLRDYPRLAKLGDKLRFNEYCDFLKSLRPQSKQEWSDEDEQEYAENDAVRIQSTIQVLEYAKSLDAYNQYGKNDISKDIAWLKSLPERFTLESKQEWSEEDELMIKCCQKAIQFFRENAQRNKKGIRLPAQFNIGGYLATTDKVESWLKSLRPVSKESLQPHWKPSEEQIHAIIEALKYLPNNKDEWMILNTLADILRKLM